MNQFTEYKKDALEQLDVLRELYEMDDDLDTGVLESAILGMEEQYEILQNGLPQAIDQELKWSKKHKYSYDISKEYYKGFIKGLEQARILFNQIGGGK
jgi:hypothetical protein